MGFIAILGGLIAMGVTMAPGVLAAIVHKRGRDRGHGSWPIYIAIVIVTILACVGAAYAMISSFEDGEGAPTEEQYTALLASFALCFSGPGLGMSLGAFALLKRAPEGTLPPRG